MVRYNLLEKESNIITFSTNTYIKNKFLKFINDDNKLKSIKNSVFITSYYHNSYDKKLVEMYFKYLDKYVKKYTNPYLMNCIWYQIYTKNSGSFHDYHTHVAPDCHVSGVYFLKIKDPSISTEFIINNKPTQFNIREGDVILFNSKIIHKSPPNNTDKDKIIISFNLDCNVYTG